MATATQQLQEEYRREARRVRARLRTRPGEMYAALRALARRADEGRLERYAPHHTAMPVMAEPVEPAGAALRLSGIAEQHFEALVRQHVSGPVLRYSVRQDLLNRAARLGIGRFQANLVIATVQHERRHLLEPATPRAAEGGMVLPLLAAAVLQVAIVTGAWWLLR